MNYKKILILGILVIFIVGISMGSVSASKTYSMKLKSDYTKTKNNVKKVGKYKINIWTWRNISPMSGMYVAEMQITKGNHYYKPYAKFYYKYKNKIRSSKWQTSGHGYSDVTFKYAIPKTAKFIKAKIKIGKKVRSI